jgi:hypothetical protein
MAKYELKWTEELWTRTIIEADSKEDALEKFWSQHFDGEVYGGEIQEGVDVEEVENE